MTKQEAIKGAAAWRRAIDRQVADPMVYRQWLRLVAAMLAEARDAERCIGELVQ